MQLALNLISEKKIAELMHDFSKDNAEEDNLNVEEPVPELKADDADDDISVLIEMVEQERAQEKDKKRAIVQAEPENEKKGGKKDTHLAGIIRKINQRFRIKKDARKEKPSKSSDYFRNEFFFKQQYSSDMNDLFSYLKIMSATDIYKDFYNNTQKDKIYNFVDTPLGFSKLQKINMVTKFARYMGYMGETEYCSHEMLDADTKEKWHLIRNITHVFVLSTLQYDFSLT